MTLDALVRAVRSAASQRIFAVRVTEVLRAHPELLVEISPTRLRCDGEVVLEAGAAEGVWLLPAYMAGLRALRPRSDVTVEDSMHLAEALAAARPDVASMQALRDWLWAGGAEGFEVQLGSSLTDAMEELAEAERLAQEGPSTARAALPMLASEAEQARVAAFDPIVLREMYEVPLERYERAVIIGAYRLAEADSEALRRRCDDPHGWAMAELEAARSIASVRVVTPAARLARRILSRLGAPFDARILVLLAALAEHDDPFVREAAQALETEDLGRLVAAHLRLDDAAAVAALERFLTGAAAPVSRAAAHQLLGRASIDADAARALTSLVASLGLPRYRAWLDEPSLEPAHTIAMLRAARSAGVGEVALHEMLAAAPGAGAVAALSTLDAAELERLTPALAALAARLEPAHAEALASLVIAHGLTPALRALGDRLLATEADGWTGRGLYAVCGALVAAGQGATYVVPLAKSRAAGVTARLVALDCVALRPELAADVSKFRLGEVLDPPEVHERILRMRARLAPGGR
jgi:hypothetical protein